MTATRKDIGQVVMALLAAKASKATKYVSPTFVIKASVRGKHHRGRNEIILTLGGPNYLERRFIAKAKRAREPFPIKKVLLKFPPARK